MLNFLLFSFVSKDLTIYERRHLRLFTNCHVSWDTLYLTTIQLYQIPGLYFTTILLPDSRLIPYYSTIPDTRLIPHNHPTTRYQTYTSQLSYFNRYQTFTSQLSYYQIPDLYLTTILLPDTRLILSPFKVATFKC